MTLNSNGYSKRPTQPTNGAVNTPRFALGAVFVYHLPLWHRQEQGLDLRVGLAPSRKAA